MASNRIPTNSLSDRQPIFLQTAENPSEALRMLNLACAATFSEFPREIQKEAKNELYDLIRERYK